MTTRAPRPLCSARLLLGLVSLVALTFPPLFLATAAQAATTPTTGNAKAIAFYRKMVKTVARYDGLYQSRSGFAVVKTASTVSWGYEITAVPAGFSPAAEVVTTALRGGKIVWVDDLMKPQCGASGNCGTNIPVQVIWNTKGEYFQELAPSKPPSCWVHSDKVISVAGDTELGVTTYTTYGHFDPMKRVGKNEIVTSTFAGINKETDTEVDTISLATHLPSSGVVYVTKKGGAPAFTYAWANSWTKSAPVQPQITMCS